MPRGVPKAGFRKTKNNIAKIAPQQLEVEVITNETDEEIDARISERFEILSDLVDGAISGDIRAMIVSGPAGLGKSFTVDRALTEWDPNETNHTVISGYVKATGLFKTLYQYRNKGQVIVFDDADSIFFDDTSLNLLKAVCDTSDRRRVSYLSEGSLIDEETAERLPKTFDFEGTIIFITNYDFDAMIDRGHKLAPHLNAMMSRAHYIDLTMKSKRDYLIRIKQVIELGLFTKTDSAIQLSAQEQADVVDFIESNVNKLRELSLRMAIKLGALRKSKPAKWKNVARVTCCRI